MFSIKKLLFQTDGWSIQVPVPLDALRDRLSQQVKPSKFIDLSVKLGYAGTVLEHGFTVSRLAQSTFRPRPTVVVTGQFHPREAETDVTVQLRQGNCFRFFAWLLCFLAIVAPIAAVTNPETNSPIESLSDLSPVAYAAVMFLIMFSVWLVVALSGYVELVLIRREINQLVLGERV